MLDRSFVLTAAWTLKLSHEVIFLRFPPFVVLHARLLDQPFENKFKAKSKLASILKQHPQLTCGNGIFSGTFPLTTVYSSREASRCRWLIFLPSREAAWHQNLCTKQLLHCVLIIPPCNSAMSTLHLHNFSPVALVSVFVVAAATVRPT
eukprot:COSAG01_NODE_461_length_16698_cov_113.458160_5_plen_149_part_00